MAWLRKPVTYGISDHGLTLWGHCDVISLARTTKFCTWRQCSFEGRTSSFTKLLSHPNVFIYEPIHFRTCSFTNHLTYKLFPLLILSITNLFRYEPFQLRTFSVTNLFRYEVQPIRTLSHTNLLRYEPFPLRTLSDTNFIRYEPLHTNLCLRTFFDTNLFLYELPHTNFLHTNFYRYEHFTYEPYPIRTFSFTNYSRYEPYTIRTLSQTNLCLRTLAYEPFPIRTLCLRTFVRLPTVLYNISLFFRFYMSRKRSILLYTILQWNVEIWTLYSVAVYFYLPWHSANSWTNITKKER